jgi:hypothetical protein
MHCESPILVEYEELCRHLMYDVSRVLSIWLAGGLGSVQQSLL